MKYHIIKLEIKDEVNVLEEKEIMSFKDEDGNEELNAVEDDKEFEEIKKEYKKLLY